MKKFLAIVSDDRHGRLDEERAVLEPLDFEVRVAKNLDSLATETRHADALLVNLTTIDAGLISGLEKCRVISRYGVGIDNIDLEAARKQGILVRNVPGYCDIEVASHALALLLALLRLPGGHRRLPGGQPPVLTGDSPRMPPGTAPGRHWGQPPGVLPFAVHGGCMGVLGFGGIGRAYAEMLVPHRPERILVHSPSLNQEKLEITLGELANKFSVRLESVSIEKLFTESDAVSLHIPLNRATHGLISANVLSMSKPGQILINTSRGALIDQAALYREICSGRLAGAGLDVFVPEPPPADEPLLSLPNVIYTHHMAWASPRSMSELKTRAAKNIAEVFSTVP